MFAVAKFVVEVLIWLVAITIVDRGWKLLKTNSHRLKIARSA